MDAPGDSQRTKTWRRIVLCAMTFGYGAYYLCKSNISVIGPLMEDDGLYTDESWGTLLAVGSAGYAAGKFFGGPVVDTFGGKWIFMIAMAISGLSTVVMGLWGQASGVFMSAWFVNRFIQAFGWAAVVGITPKWIPQRSQGKIFAIVSLSYLFGDVVVRIILGQLMHADWTWNEIMYFCAGGLGVVFVFVCFALKECPEEIGGVNPNDMDASTALVNPERDSDEKPTFQQLVAPLFKDPRFWAVCLMSASLTFVRETFREWTAMFLKNALHMQKDEAATASIVFPLAGGCATLLAGIYLDKIDRRARGPFLMSFCIGVLVSTLCLWLVVITDVVTTVSGIVLIGAIGFFLVPPFSFIAGVLAVEIAGKGRESTCSTLFEAVGYTASIAAPQLTGVLAEKGWSLVFLMLIIVGCLGTASVGLYWWYSIKHFRKTGLFTPLLEDPSAGKVDMFSTAVHPQYGEGKTVQ